MLTVVMLNVVTMNVVAPSIRPAMFFICTEKLLKMNNIICFCFFKIQLFF
jgi:hypothetical protein